MNKTQRIIAAMTKANGGVDPRMEDPTERYYVNSEDGKFGTDWPRSFKAANEYRDALNRLMEGQGPKYVVSQAKIPTLQEARADVAKISLVNPRGSN
jgi:hypothetical protein